MLLYEYDQFDHLLMCVLFPSVYSINISLFVGYNADLICLQEVDTKLFDNDLTTVLGGQGFKGHLKLKKLGQVAEGTAIFYRESKFRCDLCSLFFALLFKMNLTGLPPHEHSYVIMDIRIVCDRLV